MFTIKRRKIRTPEQSAARIARETAAAKRADAAQRNRDAERAHYAIEYPNGMYISHFAVGSGLQKWAFGPTVFAALAAHDTFMPSRRKMPVTVMVTLVPRRPDGTAWVGWLADLIKIPEYVAAVVAERARVIPGYALASYEHAHDINHVIMRRPR